MTVKCPNPQCGKGLNILPNVAKKGKVKCGHCGMVFGVKPPASSGDSENKSQPQKAKTPAKPQQTPTDSEEKVVYAESISDDDEYLI
jgi:hypothetical protein